MLLSSRMREARSERCCGQHRFASLRKCPIGSRIGCSVQLSLWHTHTHPCSTSSSFFLGKYLAFSQAPGPQCSFLSNHPLRPVYLTWLQSVACTFSHNPSSLAKWVSILSLDMPKTLACLSHQLLLIHNGPIQILAWRPALLGHLSPWISSTFYNIYSLDCLLDSQCR